MKPAPDSDHWLVRPSTVRRLSQISAVLLLLTVLVQIAVNIKGYFLIDGWFGFGALFGFLSCVAMVLAAKALGPLLKRATSYYTSGERDD